MKYMDIVFESEDGQEVLGKLMGCVHGFNAKSVSGRLAVSFPDFKSALYSDGGRLVGLPSAGSRVRLFAKEENLMEFMRSAPLVKYARLGMLHASSIAMLPVGTQMEQFTRDRSLQKNYKDNAYARRQKLRASEQGRKYEARRKMVMENSFRVEMRSVSTAAVFMLDIKSRVADAGSVCFASVNAYGLSGEGSCTPKF